jgi:hypothetical protein
MITDLLEQSKAKANEWLNSAIDDAAKQEIKKLLADENPKNLIDSFYKSLEFGTGGLRGIMGIGSNCMNRYTVGAATQGLSNYLQKSFSGEKIKVAIAFDSRNNSPQLARVAADVFSANGIEVHIFPELRPTPLLSFAIRHLKCQSGVVVANENVVFLREPDDLFQIIRIINGGGRRVVGIVQKKYFGRARDVLRNFFELRKVIIFRVDGQQVRFSRRQNHAEEMDRVARVRHERGVARLQIRVAQIRDAFFGADQRAHFFFGIERHIETLLHPVGDRFAEFGHALGLRITEGARVVMDRVDQSFHHRGRRWQVRVAHGQVNHIQVFLFGFLGEDFYPGKYIRRQIL